MTEEQFKKLFIDNFSEYIDDSKKIEKLYTEVVKIFGVLVINYIPI